MSLINCDFFSLNLEQQKSFRRVYQEYVKICDKYNSRCMDFDEYIKYISTSPSIFFEFANRYSK